MSKNKRRAVRILAGFFIVMAVCTVISRAAASLLVARVQVDQVKRGHLSYTYEGTVSVVPEKEEQIFLWPEQQIEKAAKAGTSVKAGQCLVKYRADYLDKAIDKKQAELDQLCLRRDQQKITAQGSERVPASVAAAYALQSAQEKLAGAEQKEVDAQSAYDEAAAGAGVGDADAGDAGTGDAGAGDAAEPGTVGGEVSVGGRAAGESTGSTEDADGSYTAPDTQQLYQALLGAQAETEAARQSVRDAQNAYDVACRQDQAQDINDANAHSAGELGVKEMDIQIQQAEKDLGKLREYKAAGGEIRAEQDCIVLKSPVQAGTVTNGTEVLIVGNGGWRLKGAIGEKDKDAITKGEEVEVSESQTETYKVRIESVVHNLTEDVQAVSGSSNPGVQPAGGSTAETQSAFWYAPLPDEIEGAYQKTYTWQAKAESEEDYEQLIPLTALRESTGGEYCLVLEEKSSVLGTIQTAKKVPVTVLKKDYQNAAVTSSLKRQDEIIVSSEKYVEEGDQVRIEESDK